MKLYFSPGACSLSPHIVLHEAGYDFTTERVDLKAHRTERGASLESVHAKNYVPILELDNGELLTEGTAIVQFLAITPRPPRDRPAVRAPAATDTTAAAATPAPGLAPS